MQISKEGKTYKLVIDTPRGKRKIPTKVSNKKDLATVIKQSGVKDLELLAKAGGITDQAISKILAGRNITVEKVIPEWEEWLRALGRSESTIILHGDNIRAWMKATKVSKAFPGNLKEGPISKWLNAPGPAKLATRNARLSALRSFFSFCVGKGYSLKDPTRLVEVNLAKLDHRQKEPRKKKVFTEHGVARLLEATAHNGECEDRFWHCAIAIGRWTGLRLGDICRLEWDSFSEPGKIIVWTEKRDKRVSLPMNRQLEDAVALIPMDSRKYCFPEQRACNEDRRRRSKLSVQFGRLCAKLDLLGHSFHDLRHTFITDCVAKGIPMPHIAGLVGHSSTRTTEGYNHHEKE